MQLSSSNRKSSPTELSGVGLAIARPDPSPRNRRKVIAVRATTGRARSAERFRLLANALRGETLGRFYEDLFASEARHHALFVSLAVEHFGEERAFERLAQLAELEARIVQARPWGSWIH